MPSAYHGSPLLYLWGRGIFSLRQIFKQFRTKKKHDPELAGPLASYRQSIAARNWTATLSAARGVADVAERTRDADLIAEMSAALNRLGDYGRSAQLGLAARHIQKVKTGNEWNGEDIQNGVLLIELIENSKQSLGRVIRYAQMIGSAIPRAKHCIVLVESRLVPILQRTFPKADIRASGNENDSLRAKADRFASFQQLANIFARSAPEIRKNFIPLKADADLSLRFRESYLKSHRSPLIGLSWGSKSYNKDVPSLTEWAQFIRREPAQFVSLQYGKVPTDLPRLTENNLERMIYDTSVDQLADMDRFAAQIAALDAVISISNTAAHFAGALGVPSIFVIDDKFHTNWPVLGDKIPWYPQGQVVLKDGREWTAVLEDVSRRLPAILKKSRD